SDRARLHAGGVRSRAQGVASLETGVIAGGVGATDSSARRGLAPPSRSPAPSGRNAAAPALEGTRARPWCIRGKRRHPDDRAALVASTPGGGRRVALSPRLLEYGDRHGARCSG